NDGRLAAAVGNAVRFFDVDSGTELPALRNAAAGSVCWHPDGRRLAASCSDGKIHLWDTETAREVMTPLENEIGGNVTFHPDGDVLLSGGGAAARIWDIATGRVLLTSPGLGDRFSRDGRLLGFGWEGSERVRLWRVWDGPGLRALRPRTADGFESLTAAVLHPNGRTLAASGKNSLTFFDVVSGEELASVRLPRADSARPVFFDLRGGPPTSIGPDWRSGVPED